MIDYLTQDYSTAKEPFQSLSALSDEEAIVIMEKLCYDTPYGAWVFQIVSRISPSSREARIYP